MNRIKELREENNLTQLQLANLINKTQQAISLYENQINEPDIDSFILMSKIFNCSIEYIAGKSKDRDYNGLFNLEELNTKNIEDIKIYIDFLKFKNKTKSKR